jgi:hypothetical protein
MVEHPWVFMLVLFGGLCLVLLPHKKNKKPKNTESNKQNRRQVS